MATTADAFLDNHVLLYTLGPRDTRKQAIATDLVHTLSREHAAVFCYSLADWDVVPSDPPLVMKAMARSAQNQLSI